MNVQNVDRQALKMVIIVRVVGVITGVRVAMQIVIDIPKEVYGRLCILTEHGMGSGAGNYILNGTVLPNNTTNGDMIKAMFPNLSFNVILSKMYASCGQGLLDWWNAPYQKDGGE